MRCDGRTFTETNGNIVSGKADRAVNRGPNTEQINISRNSFVFSDRLGARQQMHQTLSGHFNLQMSQKTSRRQRAPSAGHRPWTSELDPLLRGCCFVSCEQTSPGLSFQPRYRPSWDLFRDVFGWAEYSNDAIFATQPNQLKGGESLPSMNLVWMGGHQRASPRSPVLVHLMDSGCARSTLQNHDSDVQLSSQSFYFWLTHSPS